jgi:hypothetical protein
MLYSEIIDVCSQIHTKHINTLCGLNAEFFNVKLVVRIVTTAHQNVEHAHDNTFLNIEMDSEQNVPRLPARCRLEQ